MAAFDVMLDASDAEDDDQQQQSTQQDMTVLQGRQRHAVFLVAACTGVAFVPCIDILGSVPMPRVWQQWTAAVPYVVLQSRLFCVYSISCNIANYTNAEMLCTKQVHRLHTLCIWNSIVRNAVL